MCRVFSAVLQFVSGGFIVLIGVSVYQAEAAEAVSVAELLKGQWPDREAVGHDWSSQAVRHYGMGCLHRDTFR